MHGTLDATKYNSLCLFDFSIRAASCINITLEYLPLEATSEELSKKKVLLDC